MEKKQKSKKKIKWGNTPTDRLYKAILAYVKAYEGTAIVIGGIALVREGPSEFNYGIMVRCTGKLPVFKK